MSRARLSRLLAATLFVASMAACGGEGSDTTGTASSAEPEPTGLQPACVVRVPSAAPEPGEPAEPGLRQELLELKEADQADRTSAEGWDIQNDIDRTDRLREIIDEHGWPGAALVGADGASAAWLIAQHADHDVEFQREALDLMCAAVATGEADPTELAYLEDRAALNSGGVQVYGTQIGCEDGRAVPAPLADEEGVHERRAAVGLQPLEDYLAEVDELCAAESGG